MTYGGTSGQRLPERGWILRAEYYTNILYPLQDKIIPVFKDSPFYLTGGTALSRGYYNHRYSDDLDYFVNDRSDFRRITERQIDKIGTLFKDLEIDKRETDFCRLFVAENQLKIEIVNDVPSHIGNLLNHAVLGKIDSRENILANKITAFVDRMVPKDVVDIYSLLRDGLDINQALLDANSKAAGIAPLLVAKFLTEFDYGLLGKEIKWVNPVSADAVKDYLHKVALTLVKGT